MSFFKTFSYLTKKEDWSKSVLCTSQRNYLMMFLTLILLLCTFRIVIINRRRISISSLKWQPMTENGRISFSKYRITWSGHLRTLMLQIIGLPLICLLIRSQLDSIYLKEPTSTRIGWMQKIIVVLIYHFNT